MTLRRLVPGGRSGRAVGDTVSIGKNGHLFISRTLVEQLKIGRDKAAAIYYDDKEKALVFHFVDRGARKRQELIQDGLFAITQQGRNAQISGKGILRGIGVPIPERAVAVPAAVEQRTLPSGETAQVLVADLKPLLEGG